MTDRLLPLASSLLGAFPHLSGAGRQVMQLLAETRGRIGRADSLAAGVGLRNRHQLARLLKREGLPQVEELAGWICVLSWVIEWETRGTPLFNLASAADLAPPTCYRLVKRLTGVTWTQARDRGFAWVLCGFLRQCRTLSPSASENANLEQARS